MPFKAFLEHGKYEVRKHDAKGKPVGKSFGTHATEAEANAQIGAIEASMHAHGSKSSGTIGDSTKSTRGGVAVPVRDEQVLDAIIDALGGEKASKPSSKFVWEEGDIEILPPTDEATKEALLPKLKEAYARVTALPEGPEQDQLIDMMRPLTETLDFDQLMELESVAQAPMAKPLSTLATKEGGIIQRIRAALTNLTTTDVKLVDFSGGFKSFGPNGKYWVAVWANNAKDLDHEWFSDAANQRYVDAIDRGEWPLPELWYWHVPAVGGKALWVDKIDHVMLAVGQFHDTPVGRAQQAYYASGKAADHGVSHGYIFPRSAYVNHTYHDYRTFEISPLPAAVAANPYNAFEVKDTLMNAEKQRKLEEILGPALAAEVIKQAETRSKELDALGLDFKERDQGNEVLDARFLLLTDAMADMASAIKELADNQKAKGKPTADDPDADGDDDSTPEGDTDKDAGSGVPGSRKKGESTAATKAKVDPTVQAIQAQMATLAEGMKSLQEFVATQFGTVESATRAKSTIVPPTDVNVAALAKKMKEQGQISNVAPNAQPTEGQTMQEIFQTFFPTLAQNDGS